ncbi:hypothetical protein AC249_AIPGENE2141 [Exaiptasia diaphana]|nr:hypothetical protein AC249_AIPGENE2141 [Exaiptasia diaphana]
MLGKGKLISNKVKWEHSELRSLTPQKVETLRLDDYGLRLRTRTGSGLERDSVLGFSCRTTQVVFPLRQEIATFSVVRFLVVLAIFSVFLEMESLAALKQTTNNTKMAPKEAHCVKNERESKTRIFITDKTTGSPSSDFEPIMVKNKILL